RSGRAFCDIDQHDGVGGTSAASALVAATAATLDYKGMGTGADKAAHFIKTLVDPKTQMIRFT
ncbi:MAG: hypothetical protein AAF701_06375, partial [Pseudomonadota bacterium]